MTRLTIRRPDDWHLHLRDGPMLAGVLPGSRDFARALVMPNLVPPVATGAEAAAYRDRIRAALPAGQDFTPLMTLYLTESTDAADLLAAAKAGIVQAVKLYPAGATTNSHAGVGDTEKVLPVLEAMAEAGIPLSVHGEVTDPEVDIFDREAVFLDRVLTPLRARIPTLRITLEHITTAEGIAWVRAHDRTAGTITTHHLILNRNHILAGGIRPHFYCNPVAKREHHRRMLVEAATSGDARFFLGTDSAPHADPAKECACGCAGVYSAPVALPWTAQVFEEAGALDRLEAFTSLNGAAFHGLPPATARIKLERMDTPQGFDPKAATGAGPVTIFDPGRPLYWRVSP